jgi:hypothetical protein
LVTNVRLTQATRNVYVARNSLSGLIVSSTMGRMAPRKRGFASMDAEKHKKVAQAGGRAAHALGKAHELTAEEAREAGRKGGVNVARDRAHMAEIGRRGGLVRGKRKAAWSEAGTE